MASKGMAWGSWRILSLVPVSSRAELYQEPSVRDLQMGLVDGGVHANRVRPCAPPNERAYCPRNRGSSKSRMASPRTLKAQTERVNARPGQIAIQGAASM